MLTLTAIRDDRPVVNAMVSLVSVPTDAQGKVFLPSSASGQVVTAQAVGFTPHKFFFRPQSTELLLPDDSTMPYWWIKQAMYAGLDTQQLWRPDPGLLVVIPGPEAYNEIFTMDALRDGIDRINAIHQHLTFQLGVPGQQAPRAVNIKYDGASPWFAYTTLACRGATTVGAVITFNTFHLSGWPRELQRQHLVTAVAHELAHVAGIGHPQPIAGVYSEGVMWGTSPTRQFAKPEIDIMNWMFSLPAGTKPPDDTTRLPAANQSTTLHHRIVCTLH